MVFAGVLLKIKETHTQTMFTCIYIHVTVDAMDVYQSGAHLHSVP